ncbi:MAG: outer membrane beta-barrel family protein [Bergeyella sp.]
MKNSILISAIFFSGLIYAQETKKDTVKTENISEVLISKKVFKKESDRFVYDISNAPVAKGNTTFDVLKQTPLVSSTDDKTLKIAGKNNAVIYINGRKTQMDSESLVQFLKNTPAENIQKIEVITTPGSEFNVESSDGIINIVLKKKTTDGTNGNMRMANSQNKYNATSASVSLNYRKDKLGIAGNLSTSENIQAQYYVLKNGDTSVMNETTGTIDDPNKNLGGYLNADYQLNDNSNIALTWNSWANRSYDSKMEFFNTVVSPSGTNYSISRNRENARTYNNSLNLNYELKTDSLGSKLNLNMAYLNYKRFQNSVNQTILSDIAQNNLGLGKEVLQDMPQVINNFSGMADYIKKFKNDFTVSVGGNFNKTKTDNDTKSISTVYDEDGNIAELFDENGNKIDNPKSEPNHFVYDENIFGFYLNFEKKLSEKFSGKIGARYEITSSLGTSDNAQNPDYRRIERNYNNFLPFLNLNYGINDNNSVSYTFSGRMGRPSFWELNPVKTFITEDNYVQNNPFVKAATNYNQELTYMYKNSYFLVLNHSYVKDQITQVPLQRDIVKDGITYKELRYIRTNFGDKQEMTATLGMNKSFFKQYWNTNFNIGIQHNRNNGKLSIDPTNGDVFPEYVNTTNSTSFFLQTGNTIRLDKAKTWFFGINYFYIDKQQIELGMLRNLQSLDLNLKKLWNNWTFALDVTDVLRTNIIEIEDFQENGNYNYILNDEYRQKITLSLTYNFGNQKVKKVRNIDNAADEIKNRTR